MKVVVPFRALQLIKLLSLMQVSSKQMASQRKETRNKCQENNDLSEVAVQIIMKKKNRINFVNFI
jgi:hypothetical protein